MAFINGRSIRAAIFADRANPCGGKVAACPAVLTGEQTQGKPQQACDPCRLLSSWLWALFLAHIMGSFNKQPGPETAAKAVVLIRLMVGGIFLVEGILKFIYPAELGAGRFAKIGFPHAELFGPLVAIIETAGGLAILLGLLTRLAAIPLLIVISTAIVST